jgi:hypothetical protein
MYDFEMQRSASLMLSVGWHAVGSPSSARAQPIQTKQSIRIYVTNVPYFYCLILLLTSMRQTLVLDSLIAGCTHDSVQLARPENY